MFPLINTTADAVAEWQASRPVTDAEAEAAARSNFYFQLGRVTGEWETRGEWLKDAYREEARAALEAARGVTHD